MQIDEHFSGHDAAVYSIGIMRVDAIGCAENCKVVELFSLCGRAWREMSAEMYQQSFTVEGSVSGAWVPSAAGIVVAVVATGDGLEGVGMG